MYHKWLSYDAWFLRHPARRRDFFVILDHFSPCYSPSNRKNHNFEKMKKTAGHIIILHKFTINDVWFLRYEAWRIEFFVILGTFFALLSTNNPKNQNFEKLKKRPEDIIILHKSTKNHDHMLYCSWDMVHDRCNCYFSFWAIFCPFTPLTAQKIKI